MADLDIKSDVVEVDGDSAVEIKEEDHATLREIQVRVDALAKYRQELGRLFQAMTNLKDQANEVEVELANARRDLAQKYELETTGVSQWALDFEKKAFFQVAKGMPVIP